MMFDQSTMAFTEGDKCTRNDDSNYDLDKSQISSSTYH